jgi:hypothetical protein
MNKGIAGFSLKSQNRWTNIIETRMIPIYLCTVILMVAIGFYVLRF